MDIEKDIREMAACVVFPTEDGKAGTLLYGESAFGISAASENKSSAWKFVEGIPDWKLKEGMEMDEIIKIINAEAPGYYSGQKEMEDVIRVIQNRVQLYVGENR